MPSYGEIVTLLGFKSKNAAYKLVNKLIDEGVVAKDGQGKLIPTRSFGEVPLLGLVEAGIPTSVEEEELDTVDLENYLFEKKDTTFLLEVKGDSMIDAHIEEGDYVVAERVSDARDMDIVIAEVDGEWTMKHLRKKNGKIWLQPANKDFNDIYPEHSLAIAAIVRGVIRKY